MIDMEKSLAWKTNQGYADCSETLEEHNKQIYNQALQHFRKELIKIYNKRYMHDIYLDDIDDIVERLSR